MEKEKGRQKEIKLKIKNPISFFSRLPRLSTFFGKRKRGQKEIKLKIKK
ncbi:MAG: hypothetical protein IKA43_01665 [Clostridia bacterium]|nr:hypothetical protein [Clostridia bacterium]